MEHSSLSARFTSRFIAGNTLADALQVCRRLEAEQIFVTLDYLGENVTSPAEAQASRDAYLHSLDGLAAIGGEGNRCSVSLKLTQFGLDFSADDQAAEVARLEALGARRMHVDLGEPSWVVLADVEGNEFCVLSGRS